MLSNNELKSLKNLSQKKYREQEGAYLIEGVHGVEEAISIAPQLVDYVLYSEAIPFQIPAEIKSYKIEPHKLAKISLLKTPPGVMARMHMPTKEAMPELDTMVFYLDQIGNPGNMGTMIRTTDWFGGALLLLSRGCVDVYNPKVVQATMGSLHRVQYYIEGEDFILEELAQQYPLITTDMQGQDYHQLPTDVTGLMVIGNESQGVNPTLAAKAKHIIGIPRRGEAESLNAAITHGILSAYFGS